MTPAEAIEFLGIAAPCRRYAGDALGRRGQARRDRPRAAVSAPRFLLLDEPLTSLDPPRAEEIVRLLERIEAKLGLPTLLVSHSPAEVERLGGRGDRTRLTGFAAGNRNHSSPS